MKGGEWIDRKAACALLGVQPQTLYAYVSRHRIRTMCDPNDGRHSLYSASDLKRLLSQNRRPRARADVAQATIRWGDPVLSTSISEVRDGTIWLRDHPIEDCARHMSLEDTAALLCGFDCVTLPEAKPNATGKSPFGRVMKALAEETEGAQSLTCLSRHDVAQQVGRALAVVTNACLADALLGPVHIRFGAEWGLSQSATEVVRQALVLLSDHELNPSTFAVRICASTGGSLPAALLGGVAALSGPRHGGVATMATKALSAAYDNRLDQFLEKQVDRSPYSFGFGHPLYPSGDPRAAYLLDLIPQNSPVRDAVDCASSRLSRAPNVDMALAAVTRHFGLPEKAAMTIFTVGRTAGWSAHAIEQAESGKLIRPRANYEPNRFEQ